MDPFVLEYQRDDDSIYWEYRVPDLELVLRIYARDIRKQPSGIHAIISLELKRQKLAWGLINVERDEDRVRLSNSAYGKIDKYLKEAGHLPAARIKTLLDNFCFGLWGSKLGEFAPAFMSGSVQSQPTRFVLPPYIVEGGGTILFAHPKKGKSYAALLMAVCIDAGITKFWDVRQQRVMWINLERSSLSTQDRLGNMNAILGLPRDRELLTLNARGRSLADVIHAARQGVREHEVGLVVLDSISRAGMGDLNENSPVNRIIDGMNGLSKSWLGIGHAPRSSDEHLYGSIHFEAGADVVIRLLSEQVGERKRGVGFQITDANETGVRRMEVLAFDFDVMGLVGVRRANQGEFPEVEGGVVTTGGSKLWEYVRDDGPVSATEAAKALNMDRTVVSRLFKDELRYAPAGRLGTKKLYGIRERST